MSKAAWSNSNQTDKIIIENYLGIKKRIRHIAGGIQALLRPFKKDMEERYLVLKNEKLPGREDRVKIIYIYE